VGRASGIYAIKPESTAEISNGQVPTTRKFDELAKVQPATQDSGARRPLARGRFFATPS
jgi:hypothetical protein